MASDYSKYCSDFLREWYPEIKASHARELVAAFFGYKSHAALLAEKQCDVDFVDIAAIIIPDYETIDDRRACLNGLPESIPESHFLVDGLLQFLKDVGFSGEVWDHIDLCQFMLETYLPEHLDADDLDFELKDVIAETNAQGWFVEYDRAEGEKKANSVIFTVSGKYHLSQYEDGGKPFRGDTIDLEVIVELQCVAGRIAFEEPEISVTGTVDSEGIEKLVAT